MTRDTRRRCQAPRTSSNSVPWILVLHGRGGRPGMERCQGAAWVRQRLSITLRFEGTTRKTRGSRAARYRTSESAPQGGSCQLLASMRRYVVLGGTQAGRPADAAKWATLWKSGRERRNQRGICQFSPPWFVNGPFPCWSGDAQMTLGSERRQRNQADQQQRAYRFEFFDSGVRSTPISTLSGRDTPGQRPRSSRLLPNGCKGSLSSCTVG